MTEPEFVDVAAVSEIPEKGFMTCQVAGADLVLCKVNEEIFVVENRCSHAFQTFDGGRLRGTRLMCPLHGACFDIRDGKALGLPATLPIRSYASRVEGDRLLVAIEQGAD